MSTGTTLNAGTSWRRFVLLPVAALVLATSAATGASVKPLPPPIDGTTVTWRGTAGIVLRVPAATTLPAYGARLVVRGGTYASVRWAQPCPAAPEARCGVSALDYERSRAWTYEPQDPADGFDHHARLADEGRLLPGRLELYLFTDGEASLRFDVARSARTVVARGRIDGSLANLPLQTSGRVTVANTSRTFSRGLGYAEIVVSSWDRRREVLATPRAVRSCLLGPSPDGCPFDAVQEALFASYLVDPHVSLTSWHTNTYARGTVWLGGRITTGHDLNDHAERMFVVAFTYGIR